MIKLNSEQIRASNILSGNLLIIASAGTGKTTTIVERYKNLLKSGIFPEEIMMTTFTNKAAKDMINKIERRDLPISPYIGTMHSLFLKILREHKTEAFQGKEYTIITDTGEQKKIIREILEKEGLSKRADAVSYFLRWIGKFKNRGILSENLSWEGGIDEVKETGEITELLDDELIYVDPAWRKQVNKIYKKYQEYLQENNLLDFDEILILTYKLFEDNPKILMKYKNQFKSIMIDEAQDLNVVQVKILEQIKNNNLCLIGDDCQNIYEWRGSSNDLVFKFQESEEKIYLSENYRSTKEIISAVNKIIGGMENKIDKKLVSTRDSLQNINIRGFRNFNDELDFVVENVKELLDSNESPEEIVVLFRTNMIGKSVEREFRRNEIPCHLAKSIDFFDREEIKDCLAFLKLKVNENSKLDFLRIIDLVKGIGKTKIEKIIELKKTKKISYLQVLREIGELNFTDNINFEVNSLISSFGKENPLNSFLYDFGYVAYLEEKYEKEPRKLEDKIENIHVLFDLFEKHKEDIVEFLDSLIDIEKKEKTTDKVTLSTIHGAKGLEWKNVFLISCNETILPFYKDELTKAKRDSELRLFYVAISRAKDNLFITYSRFQGYKYTNPSQFLDLLYDPDW
ncbi:ATP-dependent helicase [archaeon]|nr:ATP-dependent helicase [archaeon]